MINFDFSAFGGVVVYDDFNIDENATLDQQILELKEDMLQIKLSESHTLDVGWYPSFDISGNFRVFLVENSDWQNPLYDGSANTVEQLKLRLNAAAHTFAQLADRIALLK
jgi:hypothetical protein